MDAFPEMVNRGVEQLLGRAGGPLHFRLLVMPLVVTFMAVRSGLCDARAGQPVFMWAIIAKSAERGRLCRSAVKDVGRIFAVAVVLDTIYQLLVLRAFYPVQVLIIAVACAIVPYVVVRGPVTRLARGFYKNQARPADQLAASHQESAEDRSTPTDHET
jgi:hypothetical protein